QAVVFTYNFIRDDCFSREEFFRLKFNLQESETYIDDSDYDSLYDGQHTMCIVGYDDSDQSFIVQDSRGAGGPFLLPVLKYIENKGGGTIKISQNLDYENFFYKSNKISGTYRHEFFVIGADWIKGDAKPPEINQAKVNAYERHYEITAQITDDVKVAHEVGLSIDIPQAGERFLYPTFRDGRLEARVPILEPESMSQPVMATVKITALDTSGNEAVHEMSCYFSQGLPLSFFSKDAGLVLPAQSVLASLPKGTSVTYSSSYQGPGSPFLTLPSGGVGQTVAATRAPSDDLVAEHLGRAPNSGATFDASYWKQAVGNCVAWGSLVAISIEANVNNTFGHRVIFDADSTLQGGSHVPDYIYSIVTRGYLNYWRLSPLSPYQNNIFNDLTPRYAFSNISIQQIGNTSAAKQAIKNAIDERHAVAFVLRHWKGSGPGSFNLLHEHWKAYSTMPGFDAELTRFVGITDFGNETDWMQGGHAMCIIGYDEDSFIVQNSWGNGYSKKDGNTQVWVTNRENGILRIPQDLNYDAWHYHYPTWPVTVIGGEYRFEFYKLIPNWINNDTQPPSVSELNIVLVEYDAPIVGRAYYDISFTLWDNVKLTDDTSVKISYSGKEKTLNGALLYQFTSGGTSFSQFAYLLPISYNTRTGRPMFPPVLTTVTITAYDTSGNKMEHVFQDYFELN
ncbi:MAG: hypothetical protein FWG12_02830, partial [Holophagaceae bacterium]|nr:hypothetical protein [Holophagaceae bacterium]